MLQTKNHNHNLNNYRKENITHRLNWFLKIRIKKIQFKKKNLTLGTAKRSVDALRCSLYLALNSSSRTINLSVSFSFLSSVFLIDFFFEEPVNNCLTYKSNKLEFLLNKISEQMKNKPFLVH